VGLIERAAVADPVVPGRSHRHPSAHQVPDREGGPRKIKFSHLRGQRLFGDGRYVYVDGGSFRSDTGELINGRHGRRTLVAEPGCPELSALGGNTMVFRCPSADGGSSFERYDIATGSSELLPIARTLEAADCPDLTRCTFIDDVGSRPRCRLGCSRSRAHSSDQTRQSARHAPSANRSRHTALALEPPPN
jgi:hypothetical protein